MSDTTGKKPFHQQVADQLIEKIKQGTAPWQKPWTPGASILPVNAKTGKPYRGVNTLMLMMQDQADTRWLTFNQAQEAGYKVKKGEHGTPIQYWIYSERVNKLDPVTGKPELDAKGNPVKVEVELEKPRVKIFTVFNASQIEGIPPLEVKPIDWDPHERAERILANSGVPFKHDQRDRAFYSPMFDEIHLPPKGQFADAEKYYDTALHELAHATGHETRLNRDSLGKRGDGDYAREELVAAISSMMTCAALGIEQDPNRNAAYVNSWVSELTNHPMTICQAAQQAELASQYILSREQSREQETERETLPRWVGRLEVRACREDEAGNIVSHDVPGAEAQFFGVFAKLEDGGEEHLRDFDTHGEAREYARDLEAERRADERTAAMAPPVTELVYINVPYEDRLEAKRLGAEYDGNAKSWYAPSDADAELLTGKWPAHDPAVTRAEQEEARAEHAAREAEGRIYINVPRSEKDEAKELGARWDRDAVSWYVPEGVNPDPLTSRWPQHEPVQQQEPTWEPPTEESAQTQDSAEERKREPYHAIPREERQYLTVPYKEKNAAKEAGARWDGEAARWYAGPDADMEKLSKYLPEKQVSIENNITPREELTAVLKSIGARVEGPHPVMDKKSHRIEVEGDGKGEKSGFYIGHPDGKPAGYAINNRTKEERHWVSTGHAMDDGEREALRQKAMATLRERDSRTAQTHEKTAARLEEMVAKAEPLKEPTPYMKAKGIDIHDGAYARGSTTCVPAYDATGKIKSVQYIQEDGSKSFAKNSERKGAFHAVGGLDELRKAPVVIIAEGYATAASIREATGRPIVAAFDAGNLASVAKALKEAMPDKPIVIAGDNDIGNEGKPGGNAGRKFALEAAEAVGGAAVFPTFASGETERDPKGFTDFNDLANKSALGKEAVGSQIGAAVEMRIERAKVGVEKAETLERKEEKAKSKGKER